jgi:hypothetical protein
VALPDLGPRQMPFSLIRAAIVSHKPTWCHALTVTGFCRSVQFSRRVHYRIRARATGGSTAALHRGSRALNRTVPPYGPGVVNLLDRKRLLPNS